MHWPMWTGSAFRPHALLRLQSAVHLHLKEQPMSAERIATAWFFHSLRQRPPPPQPRAAAEPTQPFTVQDMVRMERISEVAVAPDGKRVALPSAPPTWKPTRAGPASGCSTPANAARRRCASPTARPMPPQRSGAWMGSFIYFLSNRGGSSQVWRSGKRRFAHRSVAATPPAPPTPPRSPTLPLDVGSFRVSPKDDRILVSLDVFLDCADLPCTKQRLDAAAHSAATGVLYKELFVRHWDAWSDGRRSQVFAMTLDDTGVAHGHAGEFDRRHRRCSRQTIRRPRRLCLQPRRNAGGFLGSRHGRRGMVDELRHLRSSCRRRRPAAQFDGG